MQLTFDDDVESFHVDPAGARDVDGGAIRVAVRLADQLHRADAGGVDPASGHRLLFVETGDVKQGKNRVHLDLVPTDRTRDEEVARVIGLGAVEVADRRRPDGRGWVVLADPEGNEFCVLRSDAERNG